MKLYASKQALKNWIDVHTCNNVRNKMTVHLNNLINNLSHPSPYWGFRWDLWNSIPEKEQLKIISLSLDLEEWQRIMPSKKEKYIQALLNKVITRNMLVNIETGLIINRKGLFNV